jgi:hypothetical protein
MSSVVFVAALLFAPSAFAACLAVGPSTIECSGNSNGFSVMGTSANETFIFQAGVTGNITIASGGGDDRVVFSSFSTPVSVNFENGAGYQSVSAGLNIWFQGFAAPGQTFDLVGGSAGDTLTGGTGNDRFFGGAGADILTGGAGSDTRADTAPGDCAGDTLSGIETDACPAPAPPTIPTVSEWMMILMALTLAGSAVLFMQRRRTA